MPGWAPWVVFGIVAVLLIDRLLLRMEKKGWIFYRRTKGPRGGAMYHVREMASVFDPGIKYVQEEVVEEGYSYEGVEVTYDTGTAGDGDQKMAEKIGKAKLAANKRLKQYVQDRLAGTVTTDDGIPVPGPKVRWTGRRRGRRRSPLPDPAGRGREPASPRTGPPRARVDARPPSLVACARSSRCEVNLWSTAGPSC